MITYLMIPAGVIVLIWFAVLIGISMDTEIQRRGAMRIANERRRLREERKSPSSAQARDRRSCEGCPFR